ncbi:MAG: 5-deoxy-glucuronate isomerase [Sphingomonas fennica]
MSELLVRAHAPDAEGRILEVTPASAGWTYIGFVVHRLADGATLSGGADGREHCLVILTGHATVTAGTERFAGIGGRSSVFDGPGHSVYVPGGTAWTVEAEGALEIAICSAPGGGDFAPRLIAPGDVGAEVRGRDTNTRFVRNILPDDQPAHSLLVVEVVTPGGNWSSYPPHKHDRDAPPQETLLEETYYHRLDPPQGYAVQRVYTDDLDLDETITVRDGDCVLVPRGYHPVGAAHGYDLFYLNVMAGPRRKWIFANDPAHAWIVDAAK